MIQSLSSIYLTVKDHLKGGRKTHLEIDKHISNKSNPHQISKSQIESVLTGTITSHSHTTSGLSDTIEFTIGTDDHTVVIVNGLIQSWDITAS